MTDKKCILCSKVMIKRNRESELVFSKKKFCSHDCYKKTMQEAARQRREASV